MAKRKAIKRIPQAKLTPLYPKGWPSNLRAVLYLNSKARKARKEGEV